MPRTSRVSARDGKGKLLSGLAASSSCDASAPAEEPAFPRDSGREEKARMRHHEKIESFYFITSGRWVIPRKYRDKEDDTQDLVRSI